MKKTKLTRSLLAACSIVALSAVMYGCAHTDSGPSQADLDAANEAAAAAAAAQAEAEGDAAAAAEAQKTAEDAAAAAAADQKTAEDAAAAAAADQKTAEDAAAAAAADQKTAEDAAAAAAADQKEAEDKEAAAAAALKKEEDEAKAAKLKSLYAGLLRVDDGDTDNNEAPFEGVAAIIEAEHGKPATIKAPARRAASSDTVDALGSDAAFALAEATALDDLGDWAATDIAATNAAGIVDHVQVYTDINVGDDIKFGKLFPDSDAETENDAQMRMTDMLDGSTGIINSDGLNEHQGLISAMMENEDGEMVQVFQTGSGTKTHGNPDHMEEVIVIPGTFAGASGTFRCAETPAMNDCTSSGTNLGTMVSGGSSVNDDGVGTTDLAGADWTFNVDSGEVAMVPDGLFNHFGWWLRIDANGAYHVNVFHGSTEGIADVPDGLRGSATYNGQAAGKASINPQLPGRELMGGAFTGDATLTANFDATDGDATNDENGILSGMIDNIMLEGEMTDWTVALGAARILTVDVDDDGDGTAVPQGQVPTTEGDGVGAIDVGAGKVTWSIGDAGSSSSGDWSASFWNENSTDGTPDSVTGMFSATYNSTVGKMEGAFGANRE